MTHDARLPSLEEVMNGSPFDIIDSPWGHIERWRASTLATGTMGALKNVYDIVRADAAEAMARADAEEARTALIKHVCERVDALATRVDAVASELEAVKAKERADAKAAADAEEERLRQLAEDPLEDPPDISEYQARNPPSEIGDDTPAPSGELHEVAAKQEPEIEDDDTDNIGDLPPELAPPEDPVPEPKGKVLPPPTALFGN
jgi:hypothetical protein